MKRCNRNVIGLICIATGITIILALILPHWIWMVCLALILIGTGITFFR
jgi:hypothetical protein